MANIVLDSSCGQVLMLANRNEVFFQRLIVTVEALLRFAPP